MYMETFRASLQNNEILKFFEKKNLGISQNT